MTKVKLTPETPSDHPTTTIGELERTTRDPRKENWKGTPETQEEISLKEHLGSKRGDLQLS